MKSKVIKCFLFQLSICLAQNVLHVGDSCVPNKNYPEGTCKQVTECDLAQRQMMLKRSHDLKICGREYQTEIVCCPQETNPLQSSTENPVTVSEKTADRECKSFIDAPYSQSSPRIIDGEAASHGEFPHMVALGYDKDNGYEFNCGGSIISKDFVLTAAHCVSARIAEPTMVRTGVVEIGGNTWDSKTDVAIAGIFRHPLRREVNKYHDLALIRLNKSLSFSSTLNAACLETSNDDPTLPLIVTGWGKTSNTRDSKSNILQKATVRAVPINTCKEWYDKGLRLPQGIIDKQLCAGDPNGTQDACQGDSGGPLQIKTDNKVLYRLVGVISFARGCGSPVPGVYTRVAKYVDWIESIVWPQN